MGKQAQLVVLDEVFDTTWSCDEVVDIRHRHPTDPTADQHAGDFEVGLIDQIGGQAPVFPRIGPNPRLNDDNTPR